MAAGRLGTEITSLFDIHHLGGDRHNRADDYPKQRFKYMILNQDVMGKSAGQIYHHQGNNGRDGESRCGLRGKVPDVCLKRR